MNSLRYLSLLAGPLLVMLLLAQTSCGADAPDVAPDSAAVLNSMHILESTIGPSLMPATTAEIDLGRYLFFDPRLSFNGAMKCATCHQPQHAWSDGRARPINWRRQELRRRVPSLLHVGIYYQFFWDGRANTLQDAIREALRTELNVDPASVVAQIKRSPGYVELFRRAFGALGVTQGTLLAALEAFIRSLEPPDDSAFDKAQHDIAALTPSQQRGLVLFTGRARCISCHNTPDFTSNYYIPIGIKPLPGVADNGRYEVTPIPGTERAFRTPTLRDVALTGHYMHDGSFDSLDKVIDFYDRGGDDPAHRDETIRPLKLTSREKKDLVAFLGALTSTQRLVAAPTTFPSMNEDGKYALPPPLVQPGYATDASTTHGLAEPARAADKPPGRTPPPRFDRQACLKSFSIQEVLKGTLPERPDSSGNRDYVPMDMAGDLLEYYEYEAYERKDPGVCAGLAVGRKVVRPRIRVSADVECRSWYYATMFKRDMVTKSADIQNACMVSMPFGRLPAKAAPAVCAIFAQSLDDPAAACRKLTPMYMSPRDEVTCERFLKPMNGDDSVCRVHGPGTRVERELCLGWARYAQAYKAENPDLCGTSQLCRLLMDAKTTEQQRLLGDLKERACAPSMAALADLDKDD